MECPKCGFVQPTSPECINCGIIVERFKPSPGPGPQQQAGQFHGSAVPRTVAAEDPYARPIRPALRIVRALAGMVGLGVGGWLFVAGQQLTLQPYHVLFLIAYGCVSLFWILSVTLRVSVRQFVVEMLIFVTATLLLRVALPEAFDVGRLSDKAGVPLNHGLPERALQTSADAGATFLTRLEEVVSEGRTVLDKPADSAAMTAWKGRCDELRKLYRTLDARQRSDAEKQYKGLVALVGQLEAVAAAPESKESLEAAFTALEALELLLVKP